MIDYIDGGAASGKPFLASINFLANHIPVQAPESDIARYAAMHHDGWTALREARSEEHTSELQSLMRISYAVFCLKKKKYIHGLKIIYFRPTRSDDNHNK